MFSFKKLALKNLSLTQHLALKKLKHTVATNKKLYIENIVYLRAPLELDDVLRTQDSLRVPECGV